MKNLTTKQLAQHIISASYNNTPSGRYVFLVKYYGKNIYVYTNDSYLFDCVKGVRYNFYNSEPSTRGEIMGAMKIYEKAVEEYNEIKNNK